MDFLILNISYYRLLYNSLAVRLSCALTLLLYVTHRQDISSYRVELNHQSVEDASLQRQNMFELTADLEHARGCHFNLKYPLH